MMIPQLFSGALQATGNTLTPLLVTFVGVALNIPLDGAFVLGWWGFPQLGIAGAAISTVIAQTVSMVIFFVLFLRKCGVLYLDRSALKLRTAWIPKTLRIGLPAALGNSSVALGFVVMMVGIGKLDNAMAALSGYGVADRVFGLLFIATDGLGIGLTTMIGQSLGAGLMSRTREVARKGIQALLLIVVVEAAFVYFARVPLLRIFIHGDAVGAAESLREGTRFIELFAASMPFLSAFFAAQAIYRGSGHNVPSMILGFLRLWFFRIPLSFIFAYVLGMGSDGVWIGMSASNVLSGLVALGYIAWKGGWQRSRIGPPVADEAPAEASADEPPVVVCGCALAPPRRESPWYRRWFLRWFRSS
jgi:putative MATE family efflux protein